MNSSNYLHMLFVHQFAVLNVLLIVVIIMQ